MIKLRLVGASTDGSELVLSNKLKGRRGTHKVPIDDRLLLALRGAAEEQRQAHRPEVLSKAQPTAVEAPRVAPREIQKMLRSGMTVAQVARAMDLSDSYVEQFYPPIVYERDGVIRDARSRFTEKARLGGSGAALGEAVARNISARRVYLTEEQMARAWSATRHEGQPWLVSFSFPYRGRTRRASWRFDPRQPVLVAANKLAIDIGWVPNGSRRPASAPAAARKGTAGKRRRAAGTRRARKRAATKRPARKRAATRRQVRKRAPKRPARKRAATRRPARKRAATRRPVRKRTAKRPAKRATRKRARRSPSGGRTARSRRR